MLFRSPRPAGTLALLLLAGAGAAAQETFPTRTITLVVPFGPGSGTDLSTRSLAKSLGEHFQVTTVVDNKPGANGALGAQAVARARPDGYTLLVGSATTNAANYAFFPGKLGYEPSSFDIVAGVGAAPIALLVPANASWRSVGDLVAAAKAANPPMSCGSGNAVTQVACELLPRQAGFEATNVPYKSNPQSLGDLVGGQLSFAFSDTTAAQTLVQGKKLRILALAVDKRNPALPEVPTFAEQGLPKFLFTGWTAVYAPKGTPQAVMNKLNDAVNRWNDSPEAVQLRAMSGAVPLRLDPAQAKRFSDGEIARWAAYIKESGVKAE